jgi:hypothetical protein
MEETLTRQRLISDSLDSIEEQESKLLVWGIVDGHFRYGELCDLINPIIDDALDRGFDEILDPGIIILELTQIRAIIKIEAIGGNVGYRSRMAETVRLMQRLKQLFPKHTRAPDGWQEASNLVADFRFSRRRREYPRRDIPAASVIEDIGKEIESDSLVRSVETFLCSMGDNVELSGFQIRATKRILNSIEQGETNGTIVCSGTGSGKTLAFYLPAISSLLRHKRESPSEKWVKIVALYPRVELLKDQLGEVIERIESIRESSSDIFITVGAIYGDTPETAKYCDWPQSGGDRVCPYLKCRLCSGDMHWRESDLELGVEKLNCNECDWSIAADIFPLTRATIASVIPDIVFTTTEMINQRLSDNRISHLFGVGTKVLRPPELVLLDEVHTYEARHGAQVGYLLRRWTHLVGSPLRFVGLSATLADAVRYFSSLTGVWERFVAEVAPMTSEIKSEGAEYLIALRGDPVSRTALLSTSIQTTMLLERCLDPRNFNTKDTVSKGLFGQRTFVFTDDLDVTNRLFFNLLDAEGRKSSGEPDMGRHPNGGLAVLRRSGSSISRFRGGQDWRACEEIGHNLSDRLSIERVSSQDRGVTSNAQVVVATAALEVGFDDPTVGAVVQHKAPRGVASFVQRKGRAGRYRGMRPWTAIVLSDYGRDRTAYQNYDILFDPEIPPRTIPLSNRYVTRMQAVYSLIDFLGKKLYSGSDGSVWKDLSTIPKSNTRRLRLIKELQAIIESKNAAKVFQRHLRKALDISNDEALALLWEYPRPLMTMVIPTALRRLDSKWKRNGKIGKDYKVDNNPLPEFAPSTLFSDLNLSEVIIDLPNNDGVGRSTSRDVMSTLAAMKEFAPGRVSKRFGTRYRSESYWLLPEINELTDVALVDLEIQDMGEFTELGCYSYFQGQEVKNIKVLRPLSLKPTVPPSNISDTSQGRLRWHSQIVPLSNPLWLQPPLSKVWSDLIPKIGLHTHSRHAPVEIRRFAIGSTAQIGTSTGTSNQVEIDFYEDSEKVAIGLSTQVDGIVFELDISTVLHPRVSENDNVRRALRTTRYFDSARTGEHLAMVDNPFQRDWLAQIYFSAITCDAISTSSDLQSAAERVKLDSASVNLDKVLDILFQSLPVEDDEESVVSGSDKLRQELIAALKVKGVKEGLYNLGRLLWEPITSEWETWLKGVYRTTIGSALLRTIDDLCPSIDASDLVLDLGRGPSSALEQEERVDEIWITEKSPGGCGLVEEFMRVYASDPRQFFSMVRSSVEAGEFEMIDTQMSRLMEILTEHSEESPISSIVNKIRKQPNHQELQNLSKGLRISLLSDGFSAFHGFMVSIGNRILRPGTGLATDAFISNALNIWHEHELRLGVEIDLRVLSYCLSQSEDFGSMANEVGLSNDQDSPAWRMSTAYALLWARGRGVREHSLLLYHPFINLPPIERLLVVETLNDERIKVSVDEGQNWVDEVYASMSEGELITLTCSAPKPERLGTALHFLITNPVETGYLRAYARIQGFRRSEGLIEADIELIEAVQ